AGAGGRTTGTGSHAPGSVLLADAGGGAPMRAIVLASCAILMAAPGGAQPPAASAQAPQGRSGPPGQQEPVKNLQAFPKDIPRAELIAAMQAFTLALGVRCEHCHAGEPPALDYASDSKPAKQTARQMILMTRDINTKVPVAVNKQAADATRVQCVTCHRGVTIPKQLADIIGDTAAAQGGPAATDQYRELRKQ